MARRHAWIGLAMAIPATVAFKPLNPPGPPPWDPDVLAPAQPVVATAPLAPAPAPGPAAPQALPRDVGAIVVNAALTRVGAPYAWGATGPDSFDCSGLVVWAFHQAGISLPRSSQALAAGGEPVPLDQMEPGDVISFFADASHVGIYVGGGRVIHAQFEGVPVVVESLYTAPINKVPKPVGLPRWRYGFEKGRFQAPETRRILGASDTVFQQMGRSPTSCLGSKCGVNASEAVSGPTGNRL